MKYVVFLQIQEPAVNVKPEKTIKAAQKECVEVAIEPVRPVILQSRGSSITINFKTHQLPTTKEHLLKECAMVLRGIGTLPGREYHIWLKEDYKPVQHTPWQVAVSLKWVYTAEPDRLLKLGILAEVKEYTEWVKSVVPMKKPNVLWGYAWIKGISTKTSSEISCTATQFMTFYQTCQVSYSSPC